MNIRVILLGFFLIIPNVALANKFNVINNSSYGANVLLRSGSAFYCNDLSGGSTRYISAGSSSSWSCGGGQRVCFQYKKSHMNGWSDWYSDDCDSNSNSRSFN